MVLTDKGKSRVTDSPDNCSPWSLEPFFGLPASPGRGSKTVIVSCFALCGI
jgi:hypothetical protein